jgi:hypothetical protein
MKAINVLLALVVSLVVATAVLEVGLRLLGMGPQPTINQFDAQLGWVKKPNSSAHRKTGEYDVTFTINALGLRDDPMTTADKPAGVYRVLVLGDSFVQGYTVERANLFVDILENWWKAEGRDVDVINAGTEGYSTDQEVLWFLENGKKFSPDLVILCPYENDLYWDSQPKYDRYPKPRFEPSGEVEKRELVDPGPPSWLSKLAVGRILGILAHPPELFTPDGKTKLPMEWVCYFRNDPPPMREVKDRTRGALLALKKSCKEMGAELQVALIPSKACVEEEAKAKLDKQIGAAGGSADTPVDTFAALCKDLDLPTIDPRARFLEDVKTAKDGHLYYQKDWHLNPEGNRAFARVIHDELDQRGAFPAKLAAAHAAPMPIPPDPPASFGVVKVFALLWALLSLGWIATYRKDPMWQAPLKVGVMLVLIFTIAVGGNRLLALLPQVWAQSIALAFVLGLILFIAWKLGRRLGTIVELFACFVGRGHWYLIPLVVVLLSVGSLLVVAASSPLVAPFIYTLF